MSTLILMRHGQSTYNALGKFTGTTDVPLTQLGEQQAAQAANYLRKVNIDLAFTSNRIRAKDTLSILLKSLELELTTYTNDALNEQDFGDLEGLEKTKVAERYGEDKVFEWRRGMHAHPPQGEQFMAVQARVCSFYQQEIEPLLAQGKTILLVAHGNSLRALAISLLNITPSEITKFELENAMPFVLKYPFGQNHQMS